MSDRREILWYAAYRNGERVKVVVEYDARQISAWVQQAVGNKNGTSVCGPFRFKAMPGATAQPKPRGRPRTRQPKPPPMTMDDAFTA